MSNYEKINEIDKNDSVPINDYYIEKINLKDFEIGEIISRCNYGYISLCTKIKTKKQFGLKVLKKAKILDNKFIDRFYNEYKNLSIIYHPFIIELKGINYIDPYNLYYLYELIPAGPLKVYIKLYKKLSIEHSKFYLACVITILDYIHKKNIIHRDLRPENILVNDNGYIKLSEFTFSKKLNNNLTYSICSSPEYYSPEMINKSGYNESIDFWQLGILLYEMLTGKTPFYDSDPVNIYKKINNNKIYFQKDFNKNAKLIIKQFLNINMNKRLGCTKNGIYEIIMHPFFKDFDWEKLLLRKLKPPFVPNNKKFSEIVHFRKAEETILEQDNKPVPKEIDPFLNWN